MRRRSRHRAAAAFAQSKAQRILALEVCVAGRKRHSYTPSHQMVRRGRSPTGGGTVDSPKRGPSGGRLGTLCTIKTLSGQRWLVGWGGVRSVGFGYKMSGHQSLSDFHHDRPQSAPVDGSYKYPAA